MSFRAPTRNPECPTTKMGMQRIECVIPGSDPESRVMHRARNPLRSLDTGSSWTGYRIILDWIQDQYDTRTDVPYNDTRTDVPYNDTRTDVPYNDTRTKDQEYHFNQLVMEIFYVRGIC